MIREADVEVSGLTVLVEYLERHPGWQKAETIGNAIGCDPRTVSLIREASHGQVISTTAGYRLAADASDSDILDSYYQILRRSMAGELSARAIIHWARSHGRLSQDSINAVAAKVNSELTRTAAPPNIRRRPHTIEQTELFT